MRISGVFLEESELHISSPACP